MRKLVAFIFLLSLTLPSLGQEEEGGFYFGVNIGAYVANKNSAMMYSGRPEYSNFGINWVFSNPNYKSDIDNYFQYPYEIVELPTGMTYQPGVNIGGVIGYTVDESLSFFGQVSVAKLKTQDVFVVEIDNPNTNSVQKPLENVPVYGEEQRLNFDAGIKISVYSQNGVNIFLPLFVNVNSTKLEKNYFLLNNRTYPIVHNLQGITNTRPGGIGFGGGSGLGMKYRLNERFILEASYQLYYAKIKMLTEETSPINLPYPEKSSVQHGISLSIIWG